MIIYNTQQKLSSSFETQIAHTILTTNVDNKKGSEENEMIKDISSTVESRVASSTSMVYNYNKMDEQSNANLRNITDALAKYRDVNNAQLGVVQSELINIHKTQVPLHIVDIDGKARLNRQLIDGLGVKHTAQDISLNTVNNQQKKLDLLMTNVSGVMKTVNNEYMTRNNPNQLKDYTDNLGASQGYALVNKNYMETVGEMNKLNTTYDTRQMITNVQQMTKSNIARCKNTNTQIDNLQKDLVKTSVLEKTEFPISSHTLPPTIANGYTKLVLDINTNINRAENKGPVSYVDKNTYKQAKNTVMTISTPMVKFPKKDVMYIDGRAGISSSTITGKFTSTGFSDDWNTRFQNGNSVVNLSRGNGSGLQIDTKNTNPSISALNVTNYNKLLFDIKNDGISYANRLDVQKLSADSQLCINDTCIYTRDLFKVPNIIIKPPTQKMNFATTYNVESILTLNLDDFFTDVTGIVIYSIVYNPNNNIVLSGPNNRTLTVSGNYRNKQYTIVVRAANNNGGFIDGTISITEPGAQDCAISDPVWGACSRTCGGGTQTGISTIVRNKVGPGANCPPLTVSRACNTHACPVYPFPVANPSTTLPARTATMGETISVNLQNFVSCPSNTGMKFVLNNPSTYPNAYISVSMLYVTVTRPVRNYILSISATNGNGDGKTITVTQQITETGRPPVINAPFGPVNLSRTGTFYNGRSITYTNLNTHFTNFPESGNMTFSLANSTPAYISGSSLTIPYNGNSIYRNYNVVVRAQNSYGTAEQLINVTEHNI